MMPFLDFFEVFSSYFKSGGDASTTDLKLHFELGKVNKVRTMDFLHN